MGTDTDMTKAKADDGRVLANGRLRLGAIVGQGGMAIVYRADDRDLERVVAVKLLADNLAADSSFRQRFDREARFAARLAHPNIVHVYDVGEDHGQPYIVMEYVDGETLAQRLGREKRLPAETAVGIALQACAGLEEAHRQGLVHRDIKPQNLLIRHDGILKIADFGIARSSQGTALTEIGSILGTAAYLAPEQAAGETVTPATDIYALGVVLYEMLAGRPPYTVDTLAQLFTPNREQPIPAIRDAAKNVSPELEEIVMRCLAQLPEYRPPSAAALARSLANAFPSALNLPNTPLASEAPTKLSSSRQETPWPNAVTSRLRPTSNHSIRSVSNRKWLGLGVLAVVVLALVIALTQGSTSPNAGTPTTSHTPAPSLRQAQSLSKWIRSRTP